MQWVALYVKNVHIICKEKSGKFDIMKYKKIEEYAFFSVRVHL